MITNNIIRPVIYINDEELESDDVTLEVTEGEICPHCKEEFTYEQIKHVVPAANKTLTDKIIVYLNKYRKDYKLDTCQRKAHFIAQVGAEMAFLAKNMIEGAKYSHISLAAIFSNYFKSSQIIDDTILDSLEKHLTKIFKIVDKDDNLIEKTNLELKQTIKENSITANVAELYATRKIDETILKTITKKVTTKDGQEIEEVDFKIVILKRSEHFGIETLSRAYANRMDNDNEMSREGYMYSGKGIKQLTGKKNYLAFSEYRKDNPFPEDPEGYIDFSLITDNQKLEGNFNKLADTNEVIYGVQSALWFYLKGNSFRNKFPVDWADEDDARRVSYVTNGGWNGLKTRNLNTIKARSDDGFKVYKHYELFYNNGTDEQKEQVVNQLTALSKDNFKTIIEDDEEIEYNLKDSNAEVLLKKLTEKPMEKIKFKGAKAIEFEIDTKLKLITKSNNP